MLFNSIGFFLFFPAVCIIYFLLPHKIRYIWLLIASYIFYMSWDSKYVLILLLSTLITYITSLLIEKENSRNTKKGIFKRLYLLICFSSNLSILFFFKYFTWLARFANDLLHIGSGDGTSWSVPEVILPVGISFYIFQALGYSVDVYRGEVKAQRNFAKYALFVSFFPQLVAGPIERSKSLLKQIDEEHPFEYNRLIRGALLMLWGYFLKLVVADRIAIFVDTVFVDYGNYNGSIILVAAILFAFQIYCDFSGYSTIAVGAAEIMGFHLIDNFECPYFSKSIQEFWRRWHISLSIWFRDYLYIPLGGGRKGKTRTLLNITIVFLVSGLWHGANWTFLIWGIIHGIYQVIEGLTKPYINRLHEVLLINSDSLGYKLFKVITTFILVDFAWIFFRADSLRSAIDIIKSIFIDFNFFIINDGSLYSAGLDSRNFTILSISLIILLAADIFKFKGYSVRNIIMVQDIWSRWIFYLLAIFLIMIFGIWGGTYNSASFIYFQF